MHKEKRFITVFILILLVAFFVAGKTYAVDFDYKYVKMLLFKVFHFQMQPKKPPKSPNPTPDPIQRKNIYDSTNQLIGNATWDPRVSQYTLTTNTIRLRVLNPNMKFVLWLTKTGINHKYLIDVDDTFRIHPPDDSVDYRIQYQTTENLFDYDGILITEESSSASPNQQQPEGETIITGTMRLFSTSLENTPTPNLTPQKNTDCPHWVLVGTCPADKIISTIASPAVTLVCCMIDPGSSSGPVPSYPPDRTRQPTSSNQATSIPQPTQASSDALNRQLINSISETNIRQYLQNLVDNDDTPQIDEEQTRFFSKNGFIQESNYTKSFFESSGLTVQIQDVTNGRIQTRNIIGTLQGNGTNSNKYYLVTAHLDSISETVSKDVAPGADDNGSGVVAVMEIARAIKALNVTPKYSIEFILFGAEEQGTIGSSYYVDNLNGKQIEGVFNMDMIGNRGTSGDCVNFGYKDYNGGNVLSDLIVQNNNTYNIGLTARSISSSISASDHGPFWNRNIKAIFGHECAFSPVYHTTDDKTNYINYSQITKTAKAIGSAVYTLAF